MAKLTQKRLTYKSLLAKKTDKQPQHIKKAVFSWGSMSFETHKEIEQPSPESDLTNFIRYAFLKIEQIRNSKTKNQYGN